jgi:hypothetical protein
VEQFVDILKTCSGSGFAFRGICGSNFDNDAATILYNLHILLRECDASPPGLSTNHGRDTPDDVLAVFMLWGKYNRKWVLVKTFSVAHVSGIARQLLCGVNCDEYKACLTCEVTSTNAFMYFKVQ